MTVLNFLLCMQFQAKSSTPHQAKCTILGPTVQLCLWAQHASSYMAAAMDAVIHQTWSATLQCFERQAA